MAKKPKKQKKQKLDEQIIDTLKPHLDEFVPEQLLGSALQLTSGNDQKKLNKALNRLEKEKFIKRNGKGKVKLLSGAPPKKSDNREPKKKPAGGKQVFEGKFTSNKHGVGFVTVEGMERDVRIPQKHCGTALKGDWVKISVMESRGRTEGKVLEVVKRSKGFYVGTFMVEQKGVYLIDPDDKSARTSFYVPPENTGGASHFDKVIFELVDWTNTGSLPQGQVKDILGKKGSNDASMLSILAEHQLLAEFPDEVNNEAAAIPEGIPEEELNRRKDIRKNTVFTIDPEDAKDFDDGLSIKRLKNGNYYLGVHIADVTYYVQRDSLLDREAKSRGTSVYLVDRVIPMLPEKLSNGVCSLRPKEDKLAYSCFMEVTPGGKVVDYSIDETVIRSNKRFAYEDAQAILDGKQNGPFQKQLMMLSELTDTLTANRFEQGSVDLDSPEPYFELDNEGHPLDVKIKPRLKAHRLIEECMLLANRTVASHVEELRSKSKRNGEDDHPFLYRVHDKPDREKLNNVAEMVAPAGIEFKVPKGNVSPGAINELLKKVRDTNLSYTINELVLRSMAKAEYSPKNIGHFGLGFKNYAHFTSPIRRYPDVIVHRLLKAYSAGKDSYNYTELTQLGEATSESEKHAVQAERDSIKLKQVEFMSERIGETFEGVITGVTDKGLFIMVKDYFCEGMLAVHELNDDYYVYDPQRHCLVGRKRGRVYQLGRDIKIRVVATNPEQRTIDFELVN